MDSDNEDEELIDNDPDYVGTLKRVNKKEVNKLSSEKLSKILSEVFDDELLTRQKQLENIEEKIFKAQKLLHLVRYVLVSSYYKKKSLDITASEENTNTNFDSQNRIHPALKKLLGGNAKLDIFTCGKRRNATKICDNSKASTSQTSDAKRRKSDIKTDPPKKILDKNNTLSKNRRKIQHKIIVGNISKWMQLEENKTTYKWMMYVRGERESPDISHIVEKVIFYLHHTYKPHDVVQVTESPFHLSRRGWGEFPLRVQIIFKCPLNKPISIVHNLKLDKSQTGRQTLGNETVVEVYLYDNNESPKPETIIKPPDEPMDNSVITIPLMDRQMKIVEHNVDSKSLCNLDLNLAQFPNLESDFSQFNFSKYDSGFSESRTFNQSDSTLSNSHSHSAYEQSDTGFVGKEHDYCQDGDIMEEQIIDNTADTRRSGFKEYLNFEHSYSVPSETKNVDYKCDQSEKFPSGAQNQDTNKLIFGLDDTYLKGEYRTTVNASYQSSHSLKTILTNGHSDVTSIKSSESLMKPLILTPFYESRYKVTLPQNKFKNIGEALPFLLKRLPLWNKLARKEEYKTMYPFVATSHQEFEKWNIGKQLNSEWNRAKELKKILMDRFPMAKKWNTKAYFMYARTHAYHGCIENVAYLFKNKSRELTLIDKCFTESLPSKVYAGKKEENDINIDVSNGGASESFPKKSSLDISDVTLRNHCAFIREAALDCGIVLKSEEIEDGVVMNGAERMIMEAVKCLAEGLLRRSNHHSICRANRFSETSDITKYDVDKALHERSELQSIKAFQVKKREMNFFT